MKNVIIAVSLTFTLTLLACSAAFNYAFFRGWFSVGQEPQVYQADYLTEITAKPKHGR